MPYFPPSSASAVDFPNLGTLTSNLTIPANSSIVLVGGFTTPNGVSVSIPSTSSVLIHP